MDIDDAAAEREKKSPKAHRSLHEKLSSPDRKKPSPTETRRRQDEKQTKAQLNRAKLKLSRHAKFKSQLNRMQTAANIHQGKLENQEKAYEDKLK